MSNDCNFPTHNLYSQWGNIYAKGSSERQNVFKQAIAYGNVDLDNIIIHGKVQSQCGHVSVNYSKLAEVIAYNNVDLINSSATNLRSQWGNITVNQTTEDQSKISSIIAYNNVNIDRASVDGRIRSQWGHVSANQSKLGNVTAYNNIDLTNSSATDLRSEWGNVTIRQTDGTQRSFSHIAARNKVIVENSIVDNVTLHVDQNQKALLDLTNTKVSEKIVVKVSNSFLKITHNSVSLFGFTWSWGGNSSNEPKRFNILIKGTVIPENIVFEGFDADEITSEMTNNGILVTGKNK